MRLRRAALTIAIAAIPVVVAATPAHAVSCNLIVDPIGDAAVLTISRLYSAQTDIVSADVASGATTVVAVMRIASLDADVLSNIGPEWRIGWKINSTSYGVYARRGFGPLGTYRSDFTVNGVSSGAVPFGVDVVNDTITWTIPRSLLPDLATPGGTFTKFAANTLLFSSTSDAADNATATYVDQTPSCVPAA